MRFMLDTNICIYMLERKTAQVLSRLKDFSLRRCVRILHHPLGTGVRCSQEQQTAAEPGCAGRFLLAPLEILPFNRRGCLSVWRTNVAFLEEKGKSIGALDIADRSACFECVHDFGDEQHQRIWQNPWTSFGELALEKRTINPVQQGITNGYRTKT